ncbi:DnaJ domain containing protein [Rhypophila decipiens]
MIPLPPDPWKILGVEKNADKSEIRTAYKKLVLKCHPDKVQDPKLKAEKQEEFQKVQQAYELLNDDAERTKYEEQVQLMELRKQAALLSKNIANSSSPRSSSKTYTYEIRTAEIRTAELKPKGSGGGKYDYSSPHTRSHEEVTTKVYATYDDGEKHARRTASYEKPSRREEERREKDERRRRKDEEDSRILRDRERERERERDRELRERERKAEKKKQRELEEKLRDKERRRDRKSPYVEDYAAGEEDVYTAAKLDKKRSSSRKHSEYREKSMSRRDREASPAIEIIDLTSSSKTKDQALKETAADYIARSRGNANIPSPIFQRSQQEAFFQPPVAPTPPPVDFEEESIRRSSARAAGRRSSHDSPKERVLHSKPSRDAYVVDATPSKARPIPPSLAKAHSTPPVVPESPPRVSRSNTVPLKEFSRHMPQPPSFSRTQTWGGDDRRADYSYEYDESDDDHRERRHRRNSRRTRSPEPHSYRYEVVDRPKSSKHDSHYGYGESPTSRRYPPEVVEASGSYPSTIPFRVKESKQYGPEDVSYSTHAAAYAYTKPSNDQYSVYA